MKDIRGQELAVGDEIAVAFNSGHTPCLRIGTIVEFITAYDWQNEPTEKVKVSWSIGMYLPQGETAIENRGMKIVKL